MQSLRAILVVTILVVVTFLVLQSIGAYAENYELESCQFKGAKKDSKGRTLPPGLDEPLSCDHECFYDELGIDPSGVDIPNLHDMYSIGWRLINVTETPYDGSVVWTVYLERKSDESQNKCDSIYSPKQPSSKSSTSKGTS